MDRHIAKVPNDKASPRYALLVFDPPPANRTSLGIVEDGPPADVDLRGWPRVVITTALVPGQPGPVLSTERRKPIGAACCGPGHRSRFGRGLMPISVRTAPMDSRLRRRPRKRTA